MAPYLTLIVSEFCADWIDISTDDQIHQIAEYHFGTASVLFAIQTNEKIPKSRVNKTR